MLSAIIVLFVVVVFMVGLHLYVRWYLLQRRRTHVITSTNTDHCGLEPAVLNTLPVFLYSSEELVVQKKLECVVCLSEFEEKELVRLLPKCNHSFHIACIDMWFHSHSTCPLCRSPVVIESTGLDPGSDEMKVLRTEAPSELTQGRILPPKRIIRMSPVGGPAELDLESGPPG
ncbi:hypothetical protein ACJIZ3_018155 [Penstemon smallii]|uniref:RING-type E3 ubiquitin transferase n=1 Tax=Penstemon smallii TaxID=265156 RepID=A0ABD3SYW2_9LAMI